MMQSAAVLPTESPVKSLPEILGVPLQRKTFFYPFHFPLRSRWIFFQRAKRSVSRVAGFGGWEEGCRCSARPVQTPSVLNCHLKAVQCYFLVFKRAKKRRKKEKIGQIVAWVYSQHPRINLCSLAAVWTLQWAATLARMDDTSFYIAARREGGK